MVKWLERLKNLIQIEVKGPIININVTNSGNRTNCNNENIAKYDENEKRVEIYRDALNEKEIMELGIILKDYIQDGNQLLQKDTSNLLDNVLQYKKNNTDSQIINFFKDIIPPDDLEALDACLFLRDSFNKGMNISKLKEDVRKRFGDRGGNIANLCSANYFENLLMPLYNSTSREEFQRVYGLLVSNSIIAVFVHSLKSVEEIKSEITNKLEISKRYGIKVIQVHGIGERNVKKIRECIEKYKDFFKVFERKDFESNNIIMVRLLLK